MREYFQNKILEILLNRCGDCTHDQDWSTQARRCINEICKCRYIVYGHSAGAARSRLVEHGHVTVDVSTATRLCDIGKAEVIACFMRMGTPRIGQPRRHNTTVDHKAVEVRTWVGRPSREFIVDRVAQGKSAGSPSQKLPSTAIYCHFAAAEPVRPFQPFYSAV